MTVDYGTEDNPLSSLTIDLTQGIYTGGGGIVPGTIPVYTQPFYVKYGAHVTITGGEVSGTVADSYFSTSDLGGAAQIGLSTSTGQSWQSMMGDLSSVGVAYIWINQRAVIDGAIQVEVFDVGYQITIVSVYHPEGGEHSEGGTAESPVSIVDTTVSKCPSKIYAKIGAKIKLVSDQEEYIDLCVGNFGLMSGFSPLNGNTDFRIDRESTGYIKINSVASEETRIVQVFGIFEPITVSGTTYDKSNYWSLYTQARQGYGTGSWPFSGPLDSAGRVTAFSGTWKTVGQVAPNDGDFAYFLATTNNSVNIYNDPNDTDNVYVCETVSWTDESGSSHVLHPTSSPDGLFAGSFPSECIATCAMACITYVNNTPSTRRWTAYLIFIPIPIIADGGSLNAPLTEFEQYLYNYRVGGKYAKGLPDVVYIVQDTAHPANIRVAGDYNLQGDTYYSDHANYTPQTAANECYCMLDYDDNSGSTTNAAFAVSASKQGSNPYCSVRSTTPAAGSDLYIKGSMKVMYKLLYSRQVCYCTFIAVGMNPAGTTPVSTYSLTAEQFSAQYSSLKGWVCGEAALTTQIQGASVNSNSKPYSSYSVVPIGDTPYASYPDRTTSKMEITLPTEAIPVLLVKRTSTTTGATDDYKPFILSTARGVKLELVADLAIDPDVPNYGWTFSVREYSDGWYTGGPYTFPERVGINLDAPADLEATQQNLPYAQVMAAEHMPHVITGWKYFSDESTVGGDVPVVEGQITPTASNTFLPTALVDVWRYSNIFKVRPTFTEAIRVYYSTDKIATSPSEYYSADEPHTVLLPVADEIIVPDYCEPHGWEYLEGGVEITADPGDEFTVADNTGKNLMFIHALWTVTGLDDAPLALIFNSGGGTFDPQHIISVNVGTIVYSSTTDEWVWFYRDARYDAEVVITFYDIPMGTASGITPPPGMSRVVSWDVPAPFFQGKPVNGNLTYTIRPRTSQDSIVARTFYPFWYPEKQEAQSATICTPGYGTLDIGDVQSVEITYTAELVPLPIVCYGYGGAFCMDRGVRKEVAISYKRTTNPYNYDNTSGNSKLWSNGKWIKAFKNLLNRWQMMTNGSQLYLLRPESPRLHDYPEDHNDDPMRQYFIELYGENCYIESFPTAYTQNPQTIEGTVRMKMGTLYPKRDVIATLSTYFYPPDVTPSLDLPPSAYVRHYPPNMLFMLPDAVNILGTTGYNYSGTSPSNYKIDGTPIVGWKNIAQVEEDIPQKQYDFHEVANLHDFTYNHEARIFAVMGEQEAFDYYFFFPPAPDKDGNILSGGGTLFSGTDSTTGHYAYYEVDITASETKACTVNWIIVGAGGGGGLGYANGSDVHHVRTVKGVGGGGGGSGNMKQIVISIDPGATWTFTLKCGYGGRGSRMVNNVMSSSEDGGATILTSLNQQIDNLTASSGKAGGNFSWASQATPGSGGAGLCKGGDGGAPGEKGEDGRAYTPKKGSSAASGRGGTGGDGGEFIQNPNSFGETRYYLGGGGGGGGGYYPVGLENLANGANGRGLNINENTPGYGAGGRGGANGFGSYEITSPWGSRGGTGWAHVVISDGHITRISPNYNWTE